MLRKKYLLIGSLCVFSTLALFGCGGKRGTQAASSSDILETRFEGEEDSTEAEMYANASFILLDSVTVKPEGANPYISFKALLKNTVDADWICADMLQVVGNSNTSTKYPVQLGEIIYSGNSMAFVRGIANAENPDELENMQYAWKNGMIVTPTTGTTEDKLGLIEMGIYPLTQNNYAFGPAVITPSVTDAASWDLQGDNRLFLVTMNPASSMDMVMFDSDVRLLDENKEDVTLLFHSDRIEYQGGTSFNAVYESEEAKQYLPTMESFPSVLTAVKYVEWHLEDGTSVVAPVVSSLSESNTEDADPSSPSQP